MSAVTLYVFCLPIFFISFTTLLFCFGFYRLHTKPLFASHHSQISAAGSMFDSLLDALDKELRTALNASVTGLVATARARLEDMVVEVAKERAKGLAEVAEERAKGLAEVDARRGELSREIEAMEMHQAAQEGRVELNIGGYRFETSVQTLRRVPHTFFDAYFSGRYVQDVCRDGSIFVDRDGEHFGHVLEYMRDGVVSMAEPGARPSVSLLRALKREFGFYCIELMVEQNLEALLPDMAYVLGGVGDDDKISSRMKRYDALSGQWSAAAAMGVRRHGCGTCVVEGEIYVSGGRGAGDTRLSSVEKYSPSTDTWSAVTSMPDARSSHCAVTVGSAIYVLGGRLNNSTTDSVLQFDSARGTWRHVAPMPGARFVFAACAIGGDIYAFGGVDEVVDTQSSVFKYDTEANEWSTLAPMPYACMYHNAQLLDGLVYIVGADSSAALRFDPTTEVWSTLARTSVSRNRGRSFILNGKLYAAGGLGASSSMERYDAASDTWTAVADMLESRHLFSAVTVASMGPAEEQSLFDSLIAKAERGRP
jgi:N-acetylneuraminic acid mutarotase